MGGGPEAVAVWPTRLRAFTGGEKRVFNCPAQDERCYWTDAGTGPPASPEQASCFGYEVGEPLLLNWGTYFSYGYNLWGTGDRGNGQIQALGAYISIGRNTPRERALVEVPASRVKCAAEMIAVADTYVADAVWDFGIDGPPDLANGRNWPGTIHRGGANVLFCDGHVAWYVQRDLVGYTPQARRMWHNDHEP
jgi:prepilin-type processing-associated H-X9-DG protein